MKVFWHPAGRDLVVRQWRSDFCAIALMAKEEGAGDVFKMSLIAYQAEYVIRQCLMRRRPTGGSVAIGGKGVFDVAVGRQGSFVEEAGGVAWERV